MAGRDRSLIVLAALVAALFLAGAPRPAQAQATPTPQPGSLSAPQFDSTKPINIQSNRLEVDNETRVVRFEGNVVATQDDATLNSDILLIHYKAGQQSPGAAPGSPATAPPARPTPTKSAPAKPAPGASAANQLPENGGIERLIALGRVQIVQGDRKATCERAEFDQDKDTITLSGDSVVTQGENVMRGAVIVVHTDTNAVEARGTAGGRVGVTVTPKTVPKPAPGQPKPAAPDESDAGSDTDNARQPTPAPVAVPGAPAPASGRVLP